LLLLRTLNVDVDVKTVDLIGGEQHSEEFKKVNPVGKVPVLVDGDFILDESRAILAYLVNSRKPGDTLYPNDAKKRAVIDQRMYYDATVVFPALLFLVASFYHVFLKICFYKIYFVASSHLLRCKGGDQRDKRCRCKRS
jgi:glutathione S-transferase